MVAFLDYFRRKNIIHGDDITLRAKPLLQSFKMLCSLVDSEPTSYIYCILQRSTGQVKTARLFKRVSRYESELDGLKRLREEILLTSSLDHANILKPLDLCYYYNLYFIITDGGYYDGIGIMNQLNYQNNPKIAYSWVHDLIQALVFLDSQGVAHLDIRLENIIVTHTNTLKLCNFGFSVKKDNVLASPGYYIQKYNPYHTPEFLDNRIKIQNYSMFHKQDIWSSGILIFVMLEGDLPWAFPTEEDENYRWFITRGSLRHITTSISKPMNKLLLKMLCVDPERRPTITEIFKYFRNALNRIEQNEEELETTEDDIEDNESGALPKTCFKASCGQSPSWISWQLA